MKSVTLFLISAIALSACVGGGGSGPDEPEYEFPLRPSTAALIERYDQLRAESQGQAATAQMPAVGLARYDGVFSTTELVGDTRVLGKVIMDANLETGSLDGSVRNLHYRSDTHDGESTSGGLDLRGTISGSGVMGTLSGSDILIGRVAADLDGSFLGADAGLFSAGVLGTATKNDVVNPFIGGIEAARVP